MTQPAPSLQGVVRDGQVSMTDESGRLLTVPVDELQLALARGLSPATPEQVQQADIERERGTFGQQALTFGEAAASTVSLGLSDAIGSAISPEWREATRERRQVNPNVTLAGEIAGAAAPALLSGGSSLAARGALGVAAPMRALGSVGALTEAGIAAGARAVGWSGSGLASRAALRGLQMAASGAVEGAGFEITRGLVDSILNNTDYTAEKLAANLERGFKWGVIGGATVGAGSELVGAAGKKAIDSILQGRTLTQAVRDVAENKAVQAVVGDVKALAGREKEIGKKILDAGIPLDAGSAAKAAVELQARRASEAVEAAAKQLDAAGVPIPEGLFDEHLGDILAARSRVRSVSEGLRSGAGVDLVERSAGLAASDISAEQLGSYVQKLGATLSESELKALSAFIDEGPALSVALRGGSVDDILAATVGRRGLFKSPRAYAEAMFATGQDLRAALAKAPKEQLGVLYRGAALSESDIARILDEGFSADRVYSFTRSPGQAVAFANGRARDSDGLVSVVFKTDAPGVSLESIPANLAEDEFKVLRALKEKEALVDGSALKATDIYRADGAIVIELGSSKTPGAWETVAKKRAGLDGLEREKLDDLLQTAHAKAPANSELIAQAATNPAARAQLRAIGQAREALSASLSSASDWQKLQRVLAKAEQVKDVAGKAMGVVGILKALAAGKAAFLVPGLAAGAAAYAGRQLIKERGSQWLARVANALSKSETRIDDAARRIALEGSHGKSKVVAEKLGVGVVGEPDWVGPLVDQLQQQGAPNPPRRLPKIDVIGRYEALQEQAAALTDPKRAPDMLAKATGDMVSEQPELASSIQMQLMNDAAYLRANQPAGFTPFSMRPGGKQPVVSYHDKLVHVERAEALNDPAAVLEDLASGRLKLHQWEALRERRPVRYSEMRAKVLEYAMSVPELPFQTRILLGAAFELPADWSELHVAEIQAVSPAAPPEQPAAGGAQLKDIGPSMSTPAQAAIGG